ncbi:hypothetical protein MBM_09446 [Drepanopeziza brunnea f. sp. 'multigermtubi' MB_m1]|uniref:Uncharacterized protein n=1 Tax=Marssonina brunnea f. sp. multigermtubi (strain MB_m1) TaxID=1072389 RepID=K1WJK2_MARBU|nr:uncharacterized protein MBM_09446 [Drepanopeziza brunnea f. sp. 'multigermtubi' MB_m1]EKD12412.1 hypothetical protein MBM_09446 [Drepanopeziza brunnea f. sp. 'multigermtubi' MB_m1]
METEKDHRASSTASGNEAVEAVASEIPKSSWPCLQIRSLLAPASITQISDPTRNVTMCGSGRQGGGLSGCRYSGVVDGVTEYMFRWPWSGSRNRFNANGSHQKDRVLGGDAFDRDWRVESQKVSFGYPEMALQ